MTNYGNAITKPFSDMKNLGIGTILGAIPIVNMLAVYGYGMNCAKHADKKSLPKWEDIGSHVIASIVAMVTTLVYMIPAIIVGVLMAGALITTIFGSVASMGSETVDPFSMVAGMLGTMAVGMIVVLILGLIAAFLVPLALTRYVLKGGFKEAFAFGKIIKRALTGEYIITWLVYMIYAIIVSIIIGIISGVISMALLGVGFIVSMILSGFMMYIIAVTGFTMFGQLKWKD